MPHQKQKFDQELISIFKRTYRPVLTEFRKAIINNDMEYIQLISHKLAMSAELIGEPELAALADQVEKSILEKKIVEQNSCEEILKKLNSIVELK